MVEVKLPEYAEVVFATVADDGLPVRYRVLKGGRASAKSHTFASGLIIRARSKKTRILCCREIQKSIKDSVKRLLEKKIDEMGWGVLGDGSFFCLESEIRCNINGSLITFTGLRSNIDSVKSTEDIDIAYVSEARVVSQNSWDVLIPTVRNPSSEIWIDYNPGLPTDPVDVMFAGSDIPPGTIVRHVNHDDNPFLPDVMKQEMEWMKKRDYEKYLHVWEGKYQQNSEARVFKNVRIEPCPEPPEDTVFRFGADWGFSVDPTVLIRMWIDGRTLYIDREAYRIGCSMDDLPKLFAGRDGVNQGEVWTPALEAAYPGIEGVKKWTITADSARPETIDHLRKRGFKMEGAKKGAGSIMEGIEWLQSYDIVIDPQCAHAAIEFQTFSFKVDKVTGQILPLLEDKNNHVIDSARYGTEGLRKGTGYGVDNLKAWG